MGWGQKTGSHLSSAGMLVRDGGLGGWRGEGREGGKDRKVGGGLEGWVQMISGEKGRAQTNETPILSVGDIGPGQAQAGVWNL